jgi:hypothetical protein
MSPAFELTTGDSSLSLAQENAETSLGICSEAPDSNKNNV